MRLSQAIVAFAVTWAILWIVNALLPASRRIRSVLSVLIVVGLIFYLLQAFGVFVFIRIPW